ncbi:transcriptional regulator HexR [Porticoccaceae bacterium]|jgi:RpiR family carbohydrate utilization transcriptional regulator|nr:transcriptional regulator HexR [Porticoccaceae bacterium]MDC0053440.1 transcriptional regulator HexR [Gammaproteobacteria bacterium]MDA7768665.1 transcriptional regulator HexR [Porticoccaceae bacterium]MDA8598877.1 transcriptional regulator HexR [Porticoccaceae bacterium]MDA8878374.1 transcriptional regulator HexR [Porticoccaceae bacterium]|tara:strand:- start:2568 stop:3425 length:858 start_codon:yes stop_codon:yes gene_type:complete
MQHQNLVNVITDALPGLNKSERKVAEAILSDPESATGSSIASLAKRANVSEPSVNRFCKRFNTAGFPDFKLKLAKSLVSGVRFVNRNVDPNDTVESYTPKIFDSTINDLALIRDSIDHSVVNAVVDQLIQAKRVYFFGLGTSGSVARDAENKFFRFNLPVSFHDDVLMMRMLASTGSAGDVFFVISHTGRTKEIIDIAEIASNNGATVIALTSSSSPLTAVSSIALEVDVPENTDEYMAMTSRIVHLVVLDVLATGFTLRRGPDFLPHLEKIKNSLKPTRYQSKD